MLVFPGLPERRVEVGHVNSNGSRSLVLFVGLGHIAQEFLAVDVGNEGDGCLCLKEQEKVMVDSMAEVLNPGIQIVVLKVHHLADIAHHVPEILALGVVEGKAQTVHIQLTNGMRSACYLFGLHLIWGLEVSPQALLNKVVDCLVGRLCLVRKLI